MWGQIRAWTVNATKTAEAASTGVRRRASSGSPHSSANRVSPVFDPSISSFQKISPIAPAIVKRIRASSQKRSMNRGTLMRLTVQRRGGRGVARAGGPRHPRG